MTERKISVEERIEIENAETFTCMGSSVAYDLDCEKKVSVGTAKCTSKFNGTREVTKK